MQLKHNVDCSGAEIVKLGGVEYFVPALAVRQCRVVVPALAGILPQLADLVTNPAAMTAKTYETIVDVIAAALTRAYDVSRDEVLDMVIGFDEMAEAILKIGQQTGLLKPVAPGEPKGAESPQTSTESSPAIAN